MHATMAESTTKKRRTTAKGIKPDAYVIVRREGRHPDKGTVLSVTPDPKHGLIVKYRSFITGNEHITKVENVRIDRDIARRQKAIASGAKGITAPKPRRKAS